MTELELMQARAMSRRTFFGKTGLGLGALALGALEAQALPSPTRRAPLLGEGSAKPGVNRHAAMVVAESRSLVTHGHRCVWAAQATGWSAVVVLL